MKKINYFICLLATSGMSYAVNAQDQDITSSIKQSGIVVGLDTTGNQQMERDLRKRNSISNDQRIDWKDSGYGYVASYSKNNEQYMARYDQDGKYVETLTKKEWNDNAPAKLRSAYDQSNYKSQQVTAYWEVTDPSRKGYYLELNDDQNRPSRVWVDEDGKFSTSPNTVKKDY